MNYQLVIVQNVIMKSMVVSKNTIQAECFGDFFKSLGEKRLKFSKQLKKNVFKSRGGAKDITGNIAIAFRNLKAVLSTLPDVINFYQRGKGLYLGKIV